MFCFVLFLHWVRVSILGFIKKKTYEIYLKQFENTACLQWIRKTADVDAKCFNINKCYNAWKKILKKNLIFDNCKFTENVLVWILSDFFFHFHYHLTIILKSCWFSLNLYEKRNQLNSAKHTSHITKRKTAHTLLSKTGIKTIVFHSSGDQRDE